MWAVAIRLHEIKGNSPNIGEERTTGAETHLAKEFFLHLFIAGFII